jgi:predicted PurR-regulated permease PerM
MTRPSTDAVTRVVADSVADSVATFIPAGTRTDDVVDVGAARRVAGRVGIAAWTFVGVVLVIGIVVLALGVLAEVAIPVLLAALLAVVFKPASDRLVRSGRPPALASGIVLIGLVALLGAVAVACISGVTSQSTEISAAIDDAVEAIADESGIDATAIQEVRTAVNDSSALVALGSVTDLVAGVNTLIGLASGAMLGALVFYYLVKDGTLLRQRFVQIANPAHQRGLDDFITTACTTLRSYGRGRSIMSAIVTSVIGLAAALMGLPLLPSILVLTFIGGYIPYIGAFLAGAYVALIAFGEVGIAGAVVMIVVSLAANLILENFVEPRVMSHSVDLHPIVVLVVLALGGLLGGVIGLLVAVPAAAVARSAVLQVRAARSVDSIDSAPRTST